MFYCFPSSSLFCRDTEVNSPSRVPVNRFASQGPITLGSLCSSWQNDSVVVQPFPDMPIWSNEGLLGFSTAAVGQGCIGGGAVSGTKELHSSRE